MNSRLSLSEKEQQVVELLLELYRQVPQRRLQSDFSVQTKTDDSPVTNVDLWASDRCLDVLSRVFPQHLLVSEEEIPKNIPEIGSRIFIDPIDGTKHFIEGKNGYYTLIGIVEEAIPIQGFILNYKCAYILFNRGNHVYKAPVFTEQEAKKLTFNPINFHPKPLCSLILKRPPEKFKEKLKQSFSIARESYVHEHLEITGPIFEKSQGYAAYRSIHYWDLCAPLAIMKALGFDVLLFNDRQPTTLNAAQLRCQRCFVLPPNTPESLKTFLTNPALLTF